MSKKHIKSIKTHISEQVAFLPLNVFMRIKMLTFLFLFAYMCFVLFVRMKSFVKKKKKSQNCPNDPIYITTEKKAIFTPSKNLPAIFTGSKQSKTPFGRNSVTYGTPYHARGHFVFLLSPCYLQETTCYGFERAFFTLRRFLPYTPSC